MNRLGRMRGGAGFTLMELLVALLLLGLISAMALGGVRLGARTWEIVTVKAEENGRRQAVRAFLVRELGQAAPAVLEESRREPRLVYEGGRDSLIFVAPVARHFGLGGLQRLEILLEGDDDGAGRQLVLKRSPFLYADGLEAGPDEENVETHLLLDGVAEVKFSYREAGEGAAGHWLDEWRGRGELPAVLRLEVEFADPRLYWPELVVAQRVTTPPGCLPSEAQGQCRPR